MSRPKNNPANKASAQDSALDDAGFLFIQPKDKVLRDLLTEASPAPQPAIVEEATTAAFESTSKQAEKEPEPHYTGHRSRLRARFLADPKGLLDYEILELVLGLAIPRRDVKPLAKELLAEFGTIWRLVRAPTERLAKKGLTEGVIVALQSIGELAERGLKADVQNRPVIAHWEDLLSYCYAAMGAEREEQFRLLFLDNKNKLMKDEVMHKGTVNHTPAYPREIVRRALDLGASAVILVHNHPSGDPSPSQADIRLTMDIVRAAEPLGIRIHDHLIIAGNSHSSLKSLGIF